MEAEKISVIIPVFNTEGFIGDTVRSVLAQSYRNSEIILVDDGSTDGSADIIRSFNDLRISYVYQENQGRSAARNKGIALAKGEYIAFLDSDDIWTRDHLEKEVAILDGNPEVALVYTNITIIDEEGKRPKDFTYKARCYSGAPLAQLVEDNFIPFSSVMVRRKAFDDVGYFDSSMEPAEDWDLWLRMVAKGYRIHHIDEELTYYRWKTLNWGPRYQKFMVEGKIRVLNNFAGRSGLPSELVIPFGTSYLASVNQWISSVEKYPFSRGALNLIRSFPSRRILFFRIPLFWKIFIKWMIGGKASQVTMSFLRRIKVHGRFAE